MTYPQKTAAAIAKENDYPASAMLNLSQVGKQFNFFKQLPPYQEALTKLRQLLSHAALGEWEQAKTIWLNDPLLLTHGGTIYHPNCIDELDQKIEIPIEMNPGRYKYVNCTAWQIALMNEEYDVAQEMAKFMTLEEKQKQFKIFPNGKITKVNWDLRDAIERLKAVFYAIINDKTINPSCNKMNEDTYKKLNDFYLYVKPAKQQRMGLVFDVTIYLEALKLYKSKFNSFQSYAQRAFWCVRVEEYLASLLGTSYLRSHVQGLPSDFKKKDCLLIDGSSYFAFRRSSKSIPGFHFFLNYKGQQIHGGWRDCTQEKDYTFWPWAKDLLGYFEKIHQDNIKQGTYFMQQYSPQQSSLCNIL
ncbi:Uncharacterised protein [Legionella beliardensis]|uniref:Uncharacterized protein n=1 Tax=Legionella beliardensis TaxID=91822 RepID=A0A378I2D0_9GAMM|nr:hypothetical protein [Legionella beliardensis]STX28890.1 Uncharacterised protein [Legionella beliardensis]